MRKDTKIWGDQPRPHDSYRGSRPGDQAPRRCDMLKAARIRRGISRRQMDRERFAVRQWLTNGRIAPGFDEGGLHALAQEMARAL